MTFRHLGKTLVCTVLMSALVLNVSARANDGDTLSLSEFDQGLSGMDQQELAFWQPDGGSFADTSGDAQKQLDDDAKKQIGASGDSNALEAVGKTLILMLVLAGAKLVKQDMHSQRLKGQDLAPQQLQQIAIEAAKQVVDNGTTWMGILTSGILKPVASKPSKILMSIMGNAEGKDLFANLLGSGISSFIASTGWDASTELWDEATMMVSNKKDHKKTQDIIGLLSQSINNQQDRKVVEEVCDNMIKILITDPNLRTEWLYNTWRLQLAQGGFVVGVAATVGAGTIGTAIFPGAGTLAGLMFGAVGGLIAMAVPQSWDNALTVQMRNARRATDEARLAAQIMDVQSRIENKSPLQEIMDIADRADGGDGISAGEAGSVKSMVSIRQGVATTYFETDDYDRTQVRSLEFEIETAKQTLAALKSGKSAPVTAILSEEQGKQDYLENIVAHDEAVLALMKSDISKAEEGVRDFYEARLPELEKLNELAASNDTDPTSKELLREQMASVSVVNRWMKAWLKYGTNLENAKVQNWVHFAYRHGFKESMVSAALSRAKPAVN